MALLVLLLFRTPTLKYVGESRDNQYYLFELENRSLLSIETAGDYDFLYIEDGELKVKEGVRNHRRFIKKVEKQLYKIPQYEIYQEVPFNTEWKLQKPYSYYLSIWNWNQRVWTSSKWKVQSKAIRHNADLILTGLKNGFYIFSSNDLSKHKKLLAEIRSLLQDEGWKKYNYRPLEIISTYYTEDHYPHKDLRSVTYYRPDYDLLHISQNYHLENLLEIDFEDNRQKETFITGPLSSEGPYFIFINWEHMYGLKDISEYLNALKNQKNYPAQKIEELQKYSDKAEMLQKYLDNIVGQIEKDFDTTAYYWISDSVPVKRLTD